MVGTVGSWSRWSCSDAARTEPLLTPHTPEVQAWSLEPRALSSVPCLRTGLLLKEGLAPRTDPDPEPRRTPQHSNLSGASFALVSEGPAQPSCPWGHQAALQH